MNKTPEPKKITRRIEITVYDCGDPSHNHKSKDAAQKCIYKQVRKKEGAYEKQVENNRFRNLEISRAWAKGEKKSDLAKQYGLSPTTVTGAINRTLRMTSKMRVAPSRFWYKGSLEHRGVLKEEYKRQVLSKLDALEHYLQTGRVKNPVQPEETDVNLREIDGLCFRTIHNLEDNGITTLYQLIQHSKEDLIKMPSVGKKTIADIENFLMPKGLSLRKLAIAPRSAGCPQP